MKLFFQLLLLGTLFGCSDGDLQIETINFDSSPVQYCESAPTISSTLFFKLNKDEALILELQKGLLKNEVSNGTINSSVPSQSKITYRIFSENVTKNYFCSDIPPSSPIVLQEIEAVAGDVMVTTVQSATDTTAYEHSIALSGISLVNSKGERITDLSINDFGTISTKK